MWIHEFKKFSLFSYKIKSVFIFEFMNSHEFTYVNMDSHM